VTQVKKEKGTATNEKNVVYVETAPNAKKEK